MQKDISKREAGGLNAGLDEVGMGCLAGPVCVAAVIFRPGAKPIVGVDDSKKLTAKKRMKLAPIIMKEALYFGIGWAHPNVIDEKGLSEAWRRAAMDAMAGAPKVECLHIDGIRKISGYPGKQVTYIRGDSLVWQISAASIIAKVTRDLDMVGMSKHYPQYKWNKNMGYGSKEHLEALFVHGPTFYHRARYLKKIYKRYLDKIDKSHPRWEAWIHHWPQAATSAEEYEGFVDDFSTQEELEY